MEQQNIRIALGFAAGLVVGVLGFWLITYKSDSTQGVETLTDQTATPSMLMMSNTIDVANQPAGNTVEIKSLNLNQVTWVAIHDKVNGAPGKILGAKVFDKGNSSGTIELLRKTVSGTSYLVVLHSDDGNYKNFNPKTDTILTNIAGSAIMSSFDAQ